MKYTKNEMETMFENGYKKGYADHNNDIIEGIVLIVAIALVLLLAYI